MKKGMEISFQNAEERFVVLFTAPPPPRRLNNLGETVDANRDVRRWEARHPNDSYRPHKGPGYPVGRGYLFLYRRGRGANTPYVPHSS